MNLSPQCRRHDDAPRGGHQVGSEEVDGDERIGLIYHFSDLVLNRRGAGAPPHYFCSHTEVKPFYEAESWLTLRPI